MGTVNGHAENSISLPEEAGGGLRYTWLPVAYPDRVTSGRRDLHRGTQTPGKHKQDLEVRDPSAKISQSGLCKIWFVLQDKTTVSLQC